MIGYQIVVTHSDGCTYDSDIPMNKVYLDHEVAELALIEVFYKIEAAAEIKEGTGFVFSPKYDGAYILEVEIIQ